MDPSSEMCESLIKWLQSILPSKTRNISELCDGVAMLEALMQIAPDYFNKLEPKIKKDVNSSWRLIRVSNLKKIVEAIIEFYQDVLTLQLLEDGKPDVQEIGANSDPVQLAKLLRLILGCAIHCDKKEEYIRRIMEMEESVQQNIMQAIQQLEQVTGGRSGLSLLDILDSDARVLRLTADLEAAIDAKEALTQQYQQLELKLQNIIEEKQNLFLENQVLKDKENRNTDIRKQCESLKEELFKAEVMRDDFKARNDELQKQIKLNQEKIAELQLAANDTSRLKDEVDALSESAVKVQDLEIALASYKKKLEKYSDIKKTLQKLEEKNMEYLQKNLEYEEELSKINIIKNQCEAYKKQLTEIEQKLDEETQRADKAQFNYDKLQHKLSTLQNERDRLLHERDILKEENEDLKLGQPKRDSGAAVSEELTPTEMKERLRYLEKENKTLRSSIQEKESSQSMLENALTRIDQLQQQKRQMNQTIMKLEAQVEEQNKIHPDDGQQNENLIKTLKEKISNLQDTLVARENELSILQTKHNKYLEKTREVSQQLDTKSNGETSLMTNQISRMKLIEEQLLITAFNKIGLSSAREAIDERLDVLRAGQGQSFLVRQRQPTPRKQIQRFKSK